MLVRRSVFRELKNSLQLTQTKHQIFRTVIFSERALLHSQVNQPSQEVSPLFGNRLIAQNFGPSQQKPRARYDYIGGVCVYLAPYYPYASVAHSHKHTRLDVGRKNLAMD